MNAGRIADLEARLAAQTELTRHVALQAGAGTGKTAALVARIVAWSVGPGWEAASRNGDDDETVAARVLEGVVAITFSEAAAAEMASRTAEALVTLRETDPFPADAHGTVVTGLYRAALPPDEAVVRKRAGALLTQLERLYVGTIHAFARSILARFPVEAGVRPGFDVDASGEAVRELVDETVQAMLVPAFRDGDARAMALAAVGLGPAELGDAAATLVAAGVEPQVLEDDPFAEPVLEELLGRLASWIVPCRRDGAAYAAEKSKNVQAGGRLLVALAELLEHGRGTALERLRAVADLAADPGQAKAMDKLGEWANGTLNRPKPEVLDPEGFTANLARAVPRLRMLQSFDPETWRHVAVLLAPVLRRVEEIQRARGILGFNDLLRLARTVLEREAGVRRQLRSEIKQLLVDEMQDTDPEQAEIVRLLALGDDTGPGPSLFLVGDPKQSIYAFRGADFAAYERLVQAIRSAGGVQRRLEVNFRSVPAILEEVERIVAPSMKERPGVQAPFEPLSACPERAADPGFTDGGRHAVEHWLAVEVDEASGNPSRNAKVDDTARLEARAVVSDMVALHRDHGQPFSGMAILMRASTHLEPFLEALREAGVPYEVGKDRSFYRTREVAEAMALCRTILDPDDVLALTSVLRSPYVGVPDAALRPLWRAGLPRLAAAVDGPEIAPDTVAAIEKAADPVDSPVGPLGGWPGALVAFLGHLGRLRRSLAEDPPDRFVETLRGLTLAEALAAARFPGRYRLANVERFLDGFASELARASGAEPVLAWLRRVGRERPDEASARPRQDAGGVQVMTVHGAKGLGFSHVWLVQTAGGGRRRPAAANETAVQRHPATGALELRLAGIPTPRWADAEEANAEVAEAEELRLLYVAMTRAKDRLVTVGAPGYRKKKKDSTWVAPEGTFLARMTARMGGWHLDPEALAERMDPDGTLLEEGALWRLPAPGPVPSLAPPEAIAVPHVDTFLADRETLAGLRAEAAARQARPWLQAVSHEAHRELAEAVAAGIEGVETPEEERALTHTGVPRDVATAVGSAVHRVLERFDLAAADPDAELDRCRQEGARWLETAVAPDRLAVARAHLDELLGAFRSGPLWARWLGLAGHVLARELPVLLPPPDESRHEDDPVGAYRGVIDLLYRDPDTGRLVVADHKTDDPPHVEERAEAYASQLAAYARAIQEGLGLSEPPRTELWFLAAGKVV
ncbi:MAG: UvrD-helicase domain-containing protein [Acidobacteria bacterium]|nr:UvrD-helicase domain-containing protein [Acidobacteriota bacterium]